MIVENGGGSRRRFSFRYGFFMALLVLASVVVDVLLQQLRQVQLRERPIAKPRAQHAQQTHTADAVVYLSGKDNSTIATATATTTTSLAAAATERRTTTADDDDDDDEEEEAPAAETATVTADSDDGSDARGSQEDIFLGSSKAADEETATEEAEPAAVASAESRSSSSSSSSSKKVDDGRKKNGDNDGDSCGWTENTREELEHLRAIETCVRNQFKRKDGMYFSTFDAGAIRTYRCGNGNGGNNQTLAAEAAALTEVNKGSTVWFFGDSIVKQQFYTLVCTVNPNLETQRDMRIYRKAMSGGPDDPVTAEYTHRQTNTTFRMTRFGWKWNSNENNLYRRQFPRAVATLTSSDAIVVGAAVHYSSERGPLMERALEFVKAKAAISRARIYYMEPTPEEWPTSNGIYDKSSKGVCEALTGDRILGRGVSSEELSTKPEQPPNNETVAFFRKYNISAADVAAATGDRSNSSNSSSGCHPDCFPATWRLDVARKVLLSSPGSSPETESGSPTSGNDNVTVVPVWWQLVSKGTPSFSRVGDCTHKSFEAVTMMNQQLARSIINNNPNANAATKARMMATGKDAATAAQ